MRFLIKPLAILRDFALPPRCPGCGIVVEGDFRFCLACWSALDFLSDAGCAACGRPMGSIFLPDMICAPCIAHRPDHDGIKAVVSYSDIARSVVLRLKYGRKPAMAEMIARYLERHVDRTVDGIFIPVPLHKWRIWSRGYNQSALIAQNLSRRTGAALLVDGLRRTKSTPILRGMGPAARAKAVRGAFLVPKQHKKTVQGRTIWLVDDVHTSGATANACARALKQAGASRVILFCWARVLRDEY